MNDIQVFDPDPKKCRFDEFAIDSDIVMWSARWLAEALGYADYSAFNKAIQKAIQVCVTLNIQYEENFRQVARKGDSGKSTSDMLLSRFACYLAIMHADPRKPQVAKAQAFFAATVDQFRKAVKEAEEVERVTIRDDISEHERTLSSAAKGAGVTNFAFFKNKGYLGMYNMSLDKLRMIRNIPENRTPLDFMGKEELAANLFRLTQTEAKIRNERVRGQHALEKAAFDVGAKVRQTMYELSGNVPEQLPVSEDIRKVRAALKLTSKSLAKIDR